MTEEFVISPEDRYLRDEVLLLSYEIEIEKLVKKIVGANRMRTDQEPLDQVPIKSIATKDGVFDLSLSYDGVWNSNIILKNLENSTKYALSVYAVISEPKIIGLFIELYNDLRTNTELFRENQLQSEAFKFEQRRTISLFDARLDLFVFENTETLLKNMKKDLLKVLNKFTKA